MSSRPRRQVPPISEISADVYFLQPSQAFETEKPFAFRYDVGKHGIPQTNMQMGPHPCTARNIRGRERSFTLEKHGFEVVHVGDSIPYDDFHDDEAVGGYFRVLEHVLKERLGASSVRAFRHGLRKRHPDFPISTGERYDFDQPTSVAHVDTTPEEMEEYVKRLSEHQEDPFRGKTWQWINVWKPLKGPLNDWPLALCDVSTLDPQADLEPADLLYPDIATENFQVYHRPNHEWYFLAPHDITEAIVFLQADNGPGKRPGVPHCSLYNPAVPEGEDPRESIEVRLLACFEQ